MLSQDIVNDDEIKLDWFFKMSLIHDIVHVSPSLLVMFVFLLFICNLLVPFTVVVLSIFCCSILPVVYLLKLNDDDYDDDVVWRNRSFSVFQNMEACHCAINSVRSVVD